MTSFAAAMFGMAILIGTASASSFTVINLLTNSSSSSPLCEPGAATSSSGGPESAAGCAGASVGIKGSAASGGGTINSLAETSGYAESNIDDVIFTGPGSFVSGYAESNIDDVIFTGPGSFVNATVTLPFLSLQTGEFWLTPFGNSGASGTLTFGVSFYQYAGSIGLGYTGDDFTHQLVPTGSGWDYSLVQTIGPPVLSACGDPQDAVCAHWGVSYQLNGSVTFTESFPVGTPLRLVMTVQGSCGAGGIFPADCQYDALDPFGLIPGFSSFDLPDGYSVNAESIGLVNGQIPAAVPEPAPAVLFGVGCALIVGMRRVIRKRSIPI